MSKEGRSTVNSHIYTMTLLKANSIHTLHSAAEQNPGFPRVPNPAETREALHLSHLSYTHSHISLGPLLFQLALLTVNKSHFQ